MRKQMSAIITLSCDCKCRHCYIDGQPKGTTQELDIQTWKRILEDFHEQGGEEFDIHGGEPLLYDSIGELLLHANEIGLRTSMVTNALHLEDKIRHILSDCSTYTLVSLDGPEENYTSFRGVDGLDTVISNMDKLLESDVQVHPIHIVHKMNVNDLSWIVDFSLDRAIPVVTLSPIQPIGRAHELKDLLLSPDELYTFIEKLEDLNRLYQGKIRFVTQSPYRPEDERKYLAEKASLKDYNDRFYLVLNDGALIADFDLPDPRAFIIGSVFELDRLHDISYSRYRKMLDRAFLRGLSELQSGNAINWHEIVQREASDST